MGDPFDYDDDSENIENIEKKKDKELNKVINNAQNMYNFDPIVSDTHSKMFGICAKCKMFMFAEGEFTIIFAKCREYDTPLTQKNAIQKCSTFDERGSLSLWDMKGMARLIDIDDLKKNRVGF